MCGFYCMAFIKYLFAGKIFLDHTNLFSPNDYIKNDKLIYNYFKNKYVKSRIKTEKIYETRNCLLKEKKYNGLMSKKYKKICKYLNCIEYLLVLASAITNCIPVSAFASLICVPVGIRSSIK